MLALLSDLKHYISFPKIDLERDTYGWYVKQLCEHCKDQGSVDNLLDGIRHARNNGFQNDEFYLFSGLINDYHARDALNYNENAMLKVLIHCFSKDAIIEVNDAPFEYQFMEYTNTGRRLRGLKPNILSEYLESWKEFSEITDGDYLGKGNLLSDKEILNAFEDGELGTMYEDAYMSSCIVVVDENDEGIENLDQLLNMLDFSKVSPGLYYYGLIDYSGGLCDEDSLNDLGIKEIMMMLGNKERKIYEDDIFVYLNSEVNNYKALELLDRLNTCISTREVIF